MKGWLTMSSLFNKEDEDKLLPPEPCDDQYVCGVGVGRWGREGEVLGWAGSAFPYSQFVFLATEGWEGPAPALSVSLSRKEAKSAY